MSVKVSFSSTCAHPQKALTMFGSLSLWLCHIQFEAQATDKWLSHHVWVTFLSYRIGDAETAQKFENGKSYILGVQSMTELVLGSD